MFGKQLTYGKEYAAIEHAENSTFNFLKLTKKKNEFLVSKNKQATSFDTITKELKEQKHVFLILNNEQVLSKKVSISNSESKSILRAAFPNITTSDFYFEIYSSNEASFVSIARKEIIDDLILEYQKRGVAVIDFSLGNLAAKNLQPFLENKNIFSSNAQIDFNEKTISEINKTKISSETYNINDLEISNTAVLPLAGIISYYTKNTSSILQKELKERYVQKRFFDIGLKTGLGFLLTMLLINFIFFSSYREQVGNLTSELQLSESYKKQLNTLQNEVTQKKQLVASVNSASNSRLTKYIDQLGISIPNTILLTQINYQPKKGVVKADKKITFENNKMIVKGTSKENENFSNWISILEKKEWIHNISITEYGKGKKSNTLANFEFIITTNE